METVLQYVARYVCFLLLVGMLVTGCTASGGDAAEEARDIQEGETMNVMSYNIRFDNPDDGEDAWGHRDDRVVSMIRFYETDIAGVQEALYNQIEDMDAQMPGYDWVGVGRDDGERGGEFSPIFYRTERFELQDWGTLWLSEDPTEVGSVGWDAALPRVATWAVLEDRVGGGTFTVFNTHFDHRGEVARLRSAELLAERARETEGPVLLVGDLNVSPETEAYAAVTDVLDDSMDETEMPPHGPEGTFSGFEVRDELGDRIDYVFVEPGTEVLRYGTLTDQWYGRYPSDHLPVLVELRLR